MVQNSLLFDSVKTISLKAPSNMFSLLIDNVGEIISVLKSDSCSIKEDFDGISLLISDSTAVDVQEIDLTEFNVNGEDTIAGSQ